MPHVSNMILKTPQNLKKTINRNKKKKITSRHIIIKLLTIYKGKALNQGLLI